MRIKYITLSAVFVFLSVVSGIYYQLFYNGTNSKLLSIGFGCIAIVLYIISQRGNKPFYIWLAVLIYMLLIGMVSAKSWPMSSYTLVWLDIPSAVFISMGLIFADNCFERYRNKIFKLIILCALIAGAMSLVQVVGNGYSLADRYATISDNNRAYVLWGMLCSVFAYAGYSAIFSKEWRIPKITVVVLYGILGLIFQKRSIIVNLAAITVVGVYFYSRGASLRVKNAKKWVRTILLVGVAVIGITLLLRSNSDIQALFNNTILRITSSDVKNYDRGREAGRFIEVSGIPRVLAGYGIGNYFADHYGLHGMLHIGYYNILYKGGVVYAAFWLYIAVKTISALRQVKRLDVYSLACLSITISTFISMVFEFSWGETILPFCYMPFIGHICMLPKQIPNESVKRFEGNIYE